MSGTAAKRNGLPRPHRQAPLPTERRWMKQQSSTVKVWNWKDHIPLLIGGFSILFIGLRLYTISGGDFETADAIMQASGTATVVIGAIMPVIGFIAFMFGLFVSYLLLDHSVELSPRQPAILAALCLLSVGVLTVPFLFVYDGVIIVFVITILWNFTIKVVERLARYRRFSRSRRILKLRKYLTGRSSLVICLYVLAIGSFLLVITNDVPWVPSEIITTTVRPPFTGFVLNESDVDITILALNKRQIFYIPSSKVLGQTVCREKGVAYNGIQVETLLTLLSQNIQQRYPPCI
jgi:hypothetical protein